MTVKYDRQWVYYDDKGEPHSLGIGVPPFWTKEPEFDRVKDLQEHLDWIQEQINKLKNGLPIMTPIHVIEWQALNSAREKAEKEAAHWKQGYDIAEARQNRYWKEDEIARSYLKQIKSRVLAYIEANRSVDGMTIMAMVDEALSAMDKLESI